MPSVLPVALSLITTITGDEFCLLSTTQQLKPLSVSHTLQTEYDEDHRKKFVTRPHHLSVVLEVTYFYVHGIKQGLKMP